MELGGELLGERIDNMKQLEQAAQMRFDSGIAPIEDLLSVTAARINAEIEMIQEKPLD